MPIILESDFRQLFPDAVIGTVIVRGIDNARLCPQAAALLETEILRTAATLQGAEFSSLPEVAPWRAAYQRFGVKPSKYRSSIENLLRSAAAGRLRSVNPLVDLYNVISLKHLLPAGGEDLDTIAGEIRLTRALGDEHFVPLGGLESEPPPAGAVIYRDDLGVICSCWNWREADRTKLTEHTTNAILVVEGVPPISAGAVRAACEELAALATAHLGGTAVVELIGD